MASLASQMKDLRRRGIQKVLQQMGMADKTNDESNTQAYQNFVTLGNFITHLKQAVQGSTSSLEKMSKSQSNMASSVHAYVHSELADDTESTTGELMDFLNTQEEDGSVHAVALQEVSERFYYASNDITNTVLSDLMLSLEELVIKPITRDEEQNAQTKELNEERKRLNLDYDAYRRAVHNASNPSEQERNEAKLRAAKDKFDSCSRKLNDHLALRNYKRSKIIIHSILTVMQQYNKFFIASAAVLGEVAGILTPLLEHYQMDERQFMDMMRLDSRPTKLPVKDGASVPPVTKPKRDSPPPSPKPTKAPAPNPPRKAPSSPPLPREHRDAPNGYTNGPTTQSRPLVDDLMDDHKSIPNPTPAPAPAQQAAGPNLIDPWGDIGNTTTEPSPTGPSKKEAPFVDISFDTPAPPPKPTNNNGSGQPNMFSGGDMFEEIFGATPIAPQPVNMKSPPNTSPQPKPAAGSFNVPPQPQSAYFKSGAPFNNGQPQQPPQPNGNFYKMPPNFGSKPAPTGGFAGGMPGFAPNPGPGYSGMPGGFGAQAGAGFGPQPGFGGPRPAGYGFPGGPGNGGNPYTPPPSAGASFFVQETDGLDSTTASKLRQWAEKGGKKQNLRGLLSTMHEVLWPESGWEPKGPGTLIAPGDVKKAYRQATLIVHPDKVASCTEEQKIIAKRVFECLSERDRKSVV